MQLKMQLWLQMESQKVIQLVSFNICSAGKKFP